MKFLRTTYVDDWEDMETTDNPRFHVLGFTINPMHTLVYMAIAAVGLMLLVYSATLGWVSEKPWLILTITVICIAGMLAIGVIAVIIFIAMSRILRRSRTQLARLDGATHEEAEAESTRYIRRSVYGRMAIYTLIAIGIWGVLGGTLLLDLAGPLTYLGTVVAAVALLLLYSIYGDRIWAALRARSKGRR